MSWSLVAIFEALLVVVVGARQVLDRCPTHHSYQLFIITVLDRKRMAIQIL